MISISVNIEEIMWKRQSNSQLFVLSVFCWIIWISSVMMQPRYRWWQTTDLGRQLV